MGKFKIGDKVKVRDDLKQGNMYGKFYSTSFMVSHYRGMKTTVEYADLNGNFYFLKDCRKFIFTDKMLESIEDDIEEKTETIEIGDIVRIVKGKLKGIKGKVLCHNCTLNFKYNSVTNVNNYKIKIDDELEIIIDKSNIKLVKKSMQKGVYNRKEDDNCKYIIDGDRTTIILPSGIRGQVKLYKDDEYDMELGLKLAYYKAKFNEAIIEINKKENN